VIFVENHDFAIFCENRYFRRKRRFRRKYSLATLARVAHTAAAVAPAARVGYAHTRRPLHALQHALRACENR